MPRLDPSGVGLVAALILGAFAFDRAMPWLTRPGWASALFPRYRIKVVGVENVPRTGPALLVSNHVSWVDGFILTAACPRRVRFLVNAAYVDFPIIRHLAGRVGMIPVPATGPHAQKAAIRAAQAALDAGEMVGIFPEAQLTRTGLTGPFFRGVEVIIGRRTDVPVVPAALDNLWGSSFSHSGGRFLGKVPKGLRRTVGLAFGPPLLPPITAFAARQAVLEAGVHAFELRGRPAPLPETIDPDGPRLDHPTLGLLAVTARDFDEGGIRQLGGKPGTLGQPAPGVALRAVNDHGEPAKPDEEGRLQALVAGRAGWVDVGCRAALDRDGFLRPADGLGRVSSGVGEAADPRSA